MEVAKTIWMFFQDQILGMDWLNNLIGKGLGAIGLDITEKFGGSVQFFLYDVIKIFVLLMILIFVISYIQSYFPPERTRVILGRYKGIMANSASALLGTITPFCSCSSIPLFLGFSNAGLPLGVTFSFLISSPLVDLASLLLLMSIFGSGIAISYVVVGLILAVVGGSLIQKLRMEDQIETYVQPTCCCCSEGQEDSIQMTRKDRVIYANEQVIETMKKVFWYVIVGVAISAVIHNWIPAQTIQNILGSENPFSVIIAVVVGIPMYADIFGTLPIAEALYDKGVGIGTVLAFMMSVTALSLPSIIMLRKAIKPKLLITFVVIVAVGIMLMGYAFNAIEFLFL